jgi:hypothetical protein
VAPEEQDLTLCFQLYLLQLAVVAADLGKAMPEHQAALVAVEQVLLVLREQAEQVRRVLAITAAQEMLVAILQVTVEVAAGVVQEQLAHLVLSLQMEG